MASQYIRILDTRALTANASSPREQVVDLGAYRVLEVMIRVVKAGTGTDPTAVVKLQHAPVNEDDAFLDIAVTSVRVDTTAPNVPVFIEVPAYTRFIRWSTGGGVAGAPVVVIDVVAKQ
jgi:hypothetical protein